MTIDPKPGNQPDADDMSGIENGGEAGNPATTGPDPAEEEAERLGDFA